MLDVIQYSTKPEGKLMLNMPIMMGITIIMVFCDESPVDVTFDCHQVVAAASSGMM